MRDAVVDAASVGAGLWISYLFALFYFAIAAGAVTHRDLLLESPVKLPFLNIELPLKAFFILGPLVFLIVHTYVLLHFVLLAGKIGAFHLELQTQISGDDARARLRRQLPSNIFVQFLGGPREVREGIVGFLLKAVAWISLVLGPIALLVLFQLQFLPYHNPGITWWQRIAVVLDLALLWVLWPPIARGETTLLTWDDLGRVRVAAWLPASLLPLLLVFTIATFPGEWLEEKVPTVRLIPTTWKAWTSPSVQAIQTARSGWATLHELLVAGEVNYVTGRPQSLWSNVLVLPNFEVRERVKFDPEGKIAISSDTVSLRGRSLEAVVFLHAHLRKADFTGSQLQRANFFGADLSEAKFECGQIGSNAKCTQLQGAWFLTARLQGASFDGARLEGAAFDSAQLQGASLRRAQLQGAWLDGAQLQGARLEGAQLQGATLVNTQLQGATLSHAFVWRAQLPTKENAAGALFDKLEFGPKYEDRDCPVEKAPCKWSAASFAALKSLIEDKMLPGSFRLERALHQIANLENPPFVRDEASVKAWTALTEMSSRLPETLAETLRGIGCAADGAPYVIGGLIRRISETQNRVLLDYRFEHNLSQEAEVAAAFLDEAKCPGARGLSEENKAKLQEIRDRGPPAQPGPGAAAR